MYIPKVSPWFIAMSIFVMMAHCAVLWAAHVSHDGAMSLVAAEIFVIVLWVFRGRVSIPARVGCGTTLILLVIWIGIGRLSYPGQVIQCVTYIIALLGMWSLICVGESVICPCARVWPQMTIQNAFVGMTAIAVFFCLLAQYIFLFDDIDTKPIASKTIITRVLLWMISFYCISLPIITESISMLKSIVYAMLALTIFGAVMSIASIYLDGVPLRWWWGPLRLVYGNAAVVSVLIAPLVVLPQRCKTAIVRPICIRSHCQG